MNKYGSFFKGKVFLYPGILYCAAFCCLLPGFRFLVDADATGYLYVAEQIAAGNLYHSINGVWSPLGSWLLAPFIGLGFDGIVAAKWLNGLYGLISLYTIHLLLKRNHLQRIVYGLLMMAAILLLLHYSLSRLFADLLQVMLLLLYFLLVTAPGFAHHYRKIILAAVVGAIGFYAKSYVFYFILLHLPITILLQYDKASSKPMRALPVKQLLLAIFALVITCLPWAFAMKLKYNNFAFSNVGHYNITGGLLKENDQSEIFFYAPPNPGGYSIWDDPYQTVTLSHSLPKLGTLVVKQAKITASNAQSLAIACFRFSILLLPLWIGIVVATKRKQAFHQKKSLYRTSLAFIAIWCAGYLLLHIEDRFFWIIPLLTLALTGSLLEWLAASVKQIKLILATAMVALSFCIYPVDWFIHNYNRGKQTFEMANAFKQHHITGNLLSLQNDYDDMDNTVLLNYLLKSKYYGPIRNSYSLPHLEQAITQYKINYIILYYHSEAEKNEMMQHPIVKKNSALLTDVYKGVIVVKL